MALVPPPPAAGSAAERAELATLHELERTRTPAQIRAAQQDDGDETLFAFKTVLGPGFTAANFPIVAELGGHMRHEATLLSDELKLFFARARPYHADPTLNPVCPLTTTIKSYPSGHALVGYLEGFMLAQLLPGRREVILARAEDFAHNRMVCGVHYRSDTEASRTVALAWFGAMLTTPRLQAELARAREELQTGLPAAAQELR